jgi:hypothetical protein
VCLVAPEQQKVVSNPKCGFKSLGSGSGRDFVVVVVVDHFTILILLSNEINLPSSKEKSRPYKDSVHRYVPVV